MLLVQSIDFLFSSLMDTKDPRKRKIVKPDNRNRMNGITIFFFSKRRLLIKMFFLFFFYYLSMSYYYYYVEHDYVNKHALAFRIS
jgi:hypothetical protein